MSEAEGTKSIGEVIDIRSRTTRSASELARQQLTLARNEIGCDESAFAERLTTLVDWEVTPELVRCWETDVTPPGDIVIAAQSCTVATTGPALDLSQMAGVAAVYQTRSEFIAAEHPERLFDQAHRIEAAGLSHNLLCQHYPTHKLIGVLNRGAQVEMLFLEPHGEAIAQREEEERFTIGSLSTLTDLNITTLVSQVRPKLEPASMPHLQIGTYDQAIRFNLVFIDNQLCICQPYLHAARGLDTPTFVIRNEANSIYPALRSSYDWLRQNATFR